MNEIKLYGFVESSYVRKVMFFLEEKEIPYTFVFLLHKTQEAFARHPLGTIPLLEHQGMCLASSAAMCAYLERLFPSPPLYPDSSVSYAQALFFEEYASMELSKVIGRGLYIERVFKPQVLHKPTDEAVVHEAMTVGLPRVLGYLESVLPPRGPLFSRYSVADMAIVSKLIHLLIAGVPLEAERWPTTASYLASHLERPVIARIMERLKKKGAFVHQEWLSSTRGREPQEP